MTAPVVLKSEGSNQTLLSFSIANFVFLGCLPALGTIRPCFAFAGLPLHFRAKGWALSHLGLTLAASNIIKVIICGKLLKGKPWMVAPLTIANLCLSVPQVIWPDYEPAVLVGILGFAITFFSDAYQELIGTDIRKEEVRQQASRISTLSFTLGYGTAPFWGGLIYDLGKWKACAIFQLSICLLEMALAWTSPWLQDNFRHWRQQRQQHVSMHDNSASSIGGTPVVPFDSPDVPVDSSKHLQNVPFLPRDLRLPAVMLALGQFVNHYVYNTEWPVFALYFNEVFKWDSALWAGIAQMSGDIVGAAALLVLPRVRYLFSWASTEKFVALRCVTAPYHVSGLLLSWVLLNIAIASPNFIIAVTAQVVMGTVFIFAFQFITEMNAMYAGCEERIFKNMQFMTSAGFHSGYGAGAPVALTLYENFGPQAPFYQAAIVALLGFFVYTGYFVARVGLPSSFKDFEQQRACAESNA